MILEETIIPTISIIIPCYNCSRFVDEAIQSAIDQNYPLLEIIVVDDGSTDNSVERLHGWGNSIILMTGPNRGACAARNIGLAEAKGDFILFLDADDLLDGPYLWRLTKGGIGKLDVVIGSIIIEEDDGKRYPERSWPAMDSVNALLAQLMKVPLQTTAFLWRRAFVQGLGGWDESLPIAQDGDFALRMMVARPRFRVAMPGPGRVLWRTRGGADRITTRMTKHKRTSLLSMLERHEKLLVEHSDPEIAAGLTKSYYGLAKIAFACGDKAIGSAALASARRLGLAGHPGSILHRATTALLGLRMKTQIGILAYRILRRPVEKRPFPYNVEVIS